MVERKLVELWREPEIEELIESGSADFSRLFKFPIRIDYTSSERDYYEFLLFNDKRLVSFLSFLDCGVFGNGRILTLGSTKRTRELVVAAGFENIDLIALGVAEDFKNKGFGSATLSLGMASIQRIFFNKEYSKFFFIGESLNDSLNFYKKFGFKNRVSTDISYETNDLVPEIKIKSLIS